jgi:hypothetical protein
MPGTTRIGRCACRIAGGALTTESGALLTPSDRVHVSQNRCTRPKSTRNFTTPYSIASRVNSFSVKHARIVTLRVPFGELFWKQRTAADNRVIERRREDSSRRLFVFPSLLCGFRVLGSYARALCSPPSLAACGQKRARQTQFLAKLSDSLLRATFRVNSPVPSGVLVFDSRNIDRDLTAPSSSPKTSGTSFACVE